MMHPATAAHAKPLRESCMGGRVSQSSSSPSDNASHEDVKPELVLPPMTAKRPSLNTHPLQPRRPSLMSGSAFQVHAVSCAPCRGGPHIFAVKSTPRPSAHATRPSGSPTAAKDEPAWREEALGVHTPVARSTRNTDEVSSKSWAYPPCTSTCPKALSL
jgi:hypothetical protein